MSLNLVGSIYGRFFIKTDRFVPIRLQTLQSQTLLVSDWSISKKYFPLKLLGLMNQNLVGRIYGRSFIKSDRFVPIRLQTLQSQAPLVSDWSISKKYFLLKPLGQMNRNLVGRIYGRSFIKTDRFVPIRLQTLQSQALLVSDWSISKQNPLKPLGQMNRNLVGSIYGMSSIKYANLPDQVTNMATIGNS